MPSIKQGDVFSVSGDFKGFAVIFDRVRQQRVLPRSTRTSPSSPETARPERRTASIPTAPGATPTSATTREPTWHFDVAKSISYAKITLKGRTLTVKIDGGPRQVSGLLALRKTCFLQTLTSNGDFSADGDNRRARRQSRRAHRLQRIILTGRTTSRFTIPSCTSASRTQ